MLLPIALTFFSAQHMAFAALRIINRTIDDTYGDSATGLQVVYSEFWNKGQVCSGCAVQPDPSKAFEGSWHDTTSGPTSHNATMKFIGTYCFRLPVPRE